MIRWALEEGGEADRVELAKRVGARNWGPGRFTRALRESVADGLVRKIGRHRFAPADRRSPGGTASV